MRLLRSFFESLDLGGKETIHYSIKCSNKLTYEKMIEGETGKGSGS